jgi:Skp family chaperone for outer membrane proteins
MRTTERLFVYGTLAALAAAFLLRGTERSADALAHRAPTDLGPADAVVLSGKDTNLTLRNDGGRVAFGEQPTAKLWSMAAVNSDKVMKLLLKSQRFDDDRKALEEKAKTREQDIRKRAQELEAKHKETDPKSPEGEAAQKEFETLFKEYDAFRKEMQEKFSKLQAEQVEKAYREMTAAVDVVAERQKVDVVLRFVPTSQQFESDNVTSAMLQVQVRTFLRYPEAIDVTPEVMKEMSLKED